MKNTLTNLVSTPSRNKDERRSIIAVALKTKLYIIADADGIKLANHYHTKSEESFFVLDGKVQFKLEDINTHERAEYIIESGQKITIPIYVSHLVLPTRKARFIGVATEHFDPADSHKYEITW